MKQVLLSLILLPGFIMGGCNKSDTSAKLYKGVVVYDVCCNVVIQSLGPDYLGQSWVDSNNVAHPTYDHVFKVSNPRQFGSHNAGDTVTFKIVAPQIQNCICCMIYVATPNTSYPVSLIQ